MSHHVRKYLAYICLGWIMAILLGWMFHADRAVSMPSLRSLEGHPPAIPSLAQASNSPVSIAPVSSTPVSNATEYELFETGRQAFQSGNMEAALEWWQQAIAAPTITNNIAFQAVILNQMAIAHQRLEQWTDAQAMVTRGLDLINTTNGDANPDSSLVSIHAQLLNTRGRGEWVLGQPNTALDTWEAATTLYEAVGDSEGLLGSQINQVQAMETLGYYRQACDRILNILGLEQDCSALGTSHLSSSAPSAPPTSPSSPALSQSRSPQHLLDDVLSQIDAQSNESLKILGLRSLGNLLRLTGQFNLAQQVLQHGLDTIHNLSPQQEALTQLSVGTTHRDQYLQAKTLYSRSPSGTNLILVAQLADQALSSYDHIITQPTPQVDALTRLQAQLQRLHLLIDLEVWNRKARQVRVLSPIKPPAGSGSDPSPAAEWPSISVQVTDILSELQTPPPSSRLSVDIYLNLAQQLLRLHPLQSDQGWLPLAQQMAMVGVTQANQLRDPRSQSYAYGVLGRVYEEEGNRESENGAKQQERWDTAQITTLNALGLAQSSQIPEITYRWQWQLGRLAENQGQVEDAIAFYEAAVQTLDVVRNNLLGIDANVQFSFRDDVEPIYRRLVELLLTQEEGIPSQAALRRAIRDIDALQLSELENFLGCNLTESVAINDTLVDPTATIIYPIILQNQLAVITKLPQTEALHLHSIAINQEDLTDKLILFQREIARPYRSQGGLRLSQDLYDWLIRPIAPLLEESGTETLVFVLDGKLRNIPMATLHDGENYLIKHYALALMPGLQLIEPQPLSASSLDVLTFGLSQMRQQFPPHDGFEDLENVEVEVNEIKNQLPSRLYLNREFTQTTLADRIQSVNAPIVHLATHGQFSSEPTETFVLAWDQRIDINTLSAILQTRNADTNPIELLVLSACKTAEGDDRAALGLAGIAVRSGARSTLASLWTVDDQATADMMSQFYRELAQAPTAIAKAEALRRAQIKLLESDIYDAPRFWAPFILVGNWL